MPYTLYHPVYLHLEGRPVLIVGGGVVAIAVGGCGAVAPPPQLSITLRGSSQQLVRSDLTPRSFAYRLLCRQHGAAPAAMAGSSGSVLLLSLAAPITASPTTPRALQKRQLQQHSSSRGACRTYAVRFDTPQAGTECGALLQAIQRGRLRVQQQQQQQPPRRQPTQAQAAAAASQQQQKQQQQQDDDPGSSVERCLDWGDAHQLEEAVQVGGMQEASVAFFWF